MTVTLDSHFWWYVARASAMVAWALMTLSAVWGILLSTRVLRKVDNPSWLQDLHRYLAALSMIMVLLHMGSLMLDGWLQFSLGDLLVPFAADYRAFPVALGIVSFYLLAAIHGSSLLVRWLPRRFWKAIHYTSYALVVLISFHAGLSGTDVGSFWYLIVAATLIGLAAVMVIVRVVAGRAGAGSSGHLGRRSKARPVPVSGTPGTMDSVQSKAAMVSRPMTVVATDLLARDVLAIRLMPAEPGQLPGWTPGAHITVQLPNGLRRQYSLCGDPADRRHYDIAVRRTADSAGGSAWIHDQVAPGMQLEVSGPLNHFELEPAFSYLFIAGGIGITPIRAMIDSLPARRDWRLLYLGHDRSTMAFADELLARHPGRVVVQVSAENPLGTDLEALLAATSGEVYCCGPERLMARVAESVPRDRLHLERFRAATRELVGGARPIEVTCARSGTAFTADPDHSLLQALESHGLPVVGSCRSGVCGACEVRVLDGVPEHLDSVIDDAQKDRLGIIYPCVSRSVTPGLVLDL